LATDEVFYLNFYDAVWLHFDLMDEWGEIRFGIDFRELLESALARPQNEAAYGNSDIVRQAASLCFGLIKNHPWKGGNKRTATHLTEAFLDLNNHFIEYERREIIELVLAVEADEWGVDEIENWLRSRIGKL
jgi:death on curing protein